MDATRAAVRSSVRLASRRQIQASLVGFGFVGVLFLVLMQLMSWYPPTFGPAFLLLIVGLAMAVFRPALALGVVAVLAVVGDAVSMPWWPVTKNLSSGESILYIADPLTVKPIDIILVVCLVTVMVNRRLSDTAPSLRSGPLWRPMLFFFGAIVSGVIWGLAKGGDVRIAYFEAAPLLYVPLVYVLAVNLFTTTAHYRRLMVGIIIAMSIESINALRQLTDIKMQIGLDQSAFEHSAATHLNLAMLLFLAIGWFGAKRQWPRFPLVVALVPIVYLYLDGERRAGVVALIIGGMFLAIVLSFRDRQKFWRAIPIYVVVIGMYTVAFWGAGGGAGFPAQAVRSVIMPDSASESDSASDIYRDIENHNLNATIRSNPVLGVGFGQEFLKPIPLPDIGEFFEFADYIPHNTILFLWIKTGLVGFVSFIYMCALAIAHGVRTATRIRNPVDASVVTVWITFIPMFLVVAYVEISGEPATMTLLGLALAVAVGPGSVGDDDEEDAEHEDEGEPGDLERRDEASAEFADLT